MLRYPVLVRSEPSQDADIKKDSRIDDTIGWDRRTIAKYDPLGLVFFEFNSVLDLDFPRDDEARASGVDPCNMDIIESQMEILIRTHSNLRRYYY